MPRTYQTAEVAKIIGIHANTVRLYEEIGFISPPERLHNGYRVFTDLHIAQFRLARTALQVEVLQNGLRQKAAAIIKTVAVCQLAEAECLARDYLLQIQAEKANAEEALEITKQLLCEKVPDSKPLSLTRKQTAAYLQVSIDTLRNWELNGLLTVKRKQNGYRVYTTEDIQRLKIIRALRCANYSLVAILRMLRAFSHNPQVNIKQVIDTPKDNEDIISVCDKLLTSLQLAEKNAKSIITQLLEIKKMKL